MAGWIKIHRTILDKGWSSKPDYVALWVWILLQAKFRDTEYLWNGETIILRPGQFVTGRSKIAANTGIHESKVERILKCFEIEQQIEQRKTSTSRLISIINWDKFQDSEQPFEQPVNNQRTASEQPVNTNKEIKKGNNEKNGRSVFVKPTQIEVENYIFEYHLDVPPSKVKDLSSSFMDYFNSNGWLVGKSKASMKDWQASVRNWIRNDKKYSQLNNNGNTTSTPEPKFGRQTKSAIDRLLNGGDIADF